MAFAFIETFLVLIRMSQKTVTLIIKTAVDTVRLNKQFFQILTKKLNIIFLQKINEKHVSSIIAS